MNAVQVGSIVISVLLTVLNGIFMFILKGIYSRLNRQEDKTDEVEERLRKRVNQTESEIKDFKEMFNETITGINKDMAELKFNYIRRFESATKQRTEIKEVLTEKLTELNQENKDSHNEIINVLKQELDKFKEQLNN